MGLPVAAWAEATLSQGPSAIWPVGNNQLAVVGQGSVPAALATAEAVAVPAGLYGVIIAQSQAANMGLPAAPAPLGSALLLQNRWQLGSATLPRSIVTVAGQRWQIGMTQKPLRVGSAWQGVAQPIARVATPKAPVATAELSPQVVAIEPAAGLAPTAMPNVAEEPLAQIMAPPLSIFQPWRPQRVAYTAGQVQPLPPLQIISDTQTSPSIPPVSTSVPLAGILDAILAASPTMATAASTTFTTPTVATETGRGSSLGIIIPPRGRNYTEDQNEALKAVLEAAERSAADREARLGLAGMYLAWQRPEEALSVFGTLARRSDGLPNAPLPRLLMGVAQLARGQVPLANTFDQTGALAPHAQLWAAVAATQAGNYATAAEQWPSTRNVLPEYPEYLHQLVHRAHLEALVMTGQNTAALKVIEGWEQANPGKSLPPAMQYWRGLARLGTPAIAEGLEDLAAVTENTTDPTIAVRAKLDFVLALHRRRELSDTQLRAYLQDLQQDWRGDDIEQRILVILADLYDRLQQPSRALKTWQTLVQAFPKNPEVPMLAERMAQALVRVFDIEDMNTHDALTYVGLYYDFRELLPNDERGDLVQERVAEMLMRANLFARAIPILEQTLKYRALEPVMQGRLTMLLAVAYREQGRPEDTLRLLDSNRSLVTTQVLRRGWALAEAKAMLDLNRPQLAATALAPLLSPNAPVDREAQQLAADVAWQGQRWPEAEQLFGALLAQVPASTLVSTTSAQLDLFRLAYTLAQQRKNEELVALKNRYQAAWSQLPRLADDINAVAASSGLIGLSPQGGMLEPLTTALNGLNELDSQVAQVRRDVTRSRSERDEYNRRMDFMELLPPPAL